MALKVCIIPDKFKGTLTAHRAAEVMREGWLSERSGDEVTLLPMSDGGDGFGEVFAQLLGGTRKTSKTVDASHHPCEVQWWLVEDQELAIIESARAIGLAMLAPGKFHPFELDTLGLGRLMAEAADQGARKCILGIGGSATNDGGAGMARALGWAFQNNRGGLIERWTDLHTLHQIHPPDPLHVFAEVTVAVDVQNPLLGPQGCSRVYGPQKGLLPEDFEFAERCLGTLVRIMNEHSPAHHENVAGAGAAGGLGYGLMSFCGARLRHGFDLFAEHTQLEKVLQETDLVLTAEGALDRQTLMGKGVGEIGARCRKHGVPCLALAGRIEDLKEARTMFDQAHALTPDFASPERSMRDPGQCLQELTQQVARDYTPPKTALSGQNPC